MAADTAGALPYFYICQTVRIKVAFKSRHPLLLLGVCQGYSNLTMQICEMGNYTDTFKKGIGVLYGAE